MAKSKNSKKGKKPSFNKITSAAVTVYRGPLLTPGSKSGTALREIVIAYQANVASTAGGVIANVFSNDPSQSGDWANIQATASEYRVLRTDWEYYPQNKYNRTATTVVPGLRVIDRSGAGALAGYANAANHDSVQIMALDEPWHMTASMTGTDEAGFIQIAGAAAPYAWLKLYASGESISTTYGLMLVRIRLQLKSTE